MVCKEYACHILFSYIIMKLRYETNCWSLFWVYKFNQKWKNLKIQKKKIFFNFFSIFYFCLFLIFWQHCVHKSNQIFETSPFLKKLDTPNCPKNKKNGKIFFQKNWKKKFFFVFLKFFISDRIYTPKIMTNNLSHVFSSWLYTKKVCDRHTLCTPRPTKAPLCS